MGLSRAGSIGRSFALGRATFVLKGFGIWLLITTTGFLEFDFTNSWPLLVVLIGLGLIIDGVVNAARPQPQLPGGE